LKYITPNTTDQFNDAISLFQEYANSLNISLAFQNFDEELNIINSMYGSPTGCLLLVYDNELPIACAAYRKIGEDICELKRMYIKPDYRRNGVGQEIMNILCKFAGWMGFFVLQINLRTRGRPF
jgi:GNAT superfamily N-acetyltransferase